MYPVREMSTGTPAMAPRVMRKYFRLADVGIGDGVEQPPRCRPLQGERGHLLGDVLDRDVEADRVLREPSQAGIGGGPAKGVFGEARHGPIVDDLAVLVAPRRVVTPVRPPA